MKSGWPIERLIRDLTSPTDHRPQAKKDSN